MVQAGHSCEEADDYYDDPEELIEDETYGNLGDLEGLGYDDDEKVITEGSEVKQTISHYY